MKLLVATDAHLYKTPDGNYWCKSIYGYKFWTRYLYVFDSIVIVARTKNVEVLEGRNLLVSGDNVEIRPIPFFQGPFQLIKKFLSVRKSLKNIDSGCDAALFRMPSVTASLVYKTISKKIPVAGEIVYNQHDDVVSKQPLLLKIINFIISRNLKKFCIKANGVSYVTEHSIQDFYPSFAKLHGESNEYFETTYSTITLEDDAFGTEKNFLNKKSFILALSSVAMNSTRKGEKILIEIVKICRDKGYDVSAVIIGDGSLKSNFEDYAKQLGVEDYVLFTGLLASSDEVRERLKKCDIYVFPTEAEGLPRGILEAMAIGMPVLSTPVGGIPEIIESKYLFSPTDATAFSNMLISLFENSNELNRISKENLIKSYQFKNSILQDKRNSFYQKLRDLCKNNE